MRLLHLQYLVHSSEVGLSHHRQPRGQRRPRLPRPRREEEDSRQRAAHRTGHSPLLSSPSAEQEGWVSHGRQADESPWQLLAARARSRPLFRARQGIQATVERFGARIQQSVQVRASKVYEVVRSGECRHDHEFAFTSNRASGGCASSARYDGRGGQQYSHTEGPLARAVESHGAHSDVLPQRGVRAAHVSARRWLWRRWDEHRGRGGSTRLVRGRRSRRCSRRTPCLHRCIHRGERL